MQQKHGVPQRVVIQDTPGKTRRFVFWGLVIWCLAGLLYYYLHHEVLQPDLEINVWIFYVALILSYNLLYTLTYSIPVILIFAVLLKGMEILFHRLTSGR
ncbi:MAG: hypothetical protein AAFZ63_28685 [Bacteroidota bacterium]